MNEKIKNKKMGAGCSLFRKYRPLVGKGEQGLCDIDLMVQIKDSYCMIMTTATTYLRENFQVSDQVFNHKMEGIDDFEKMYISNNVGNFAMCYGRICDYEISGTSWHETKEFITKCRNRYMMSKNNDNV